MAPAAVSARIRLLDAALGAIRAKGYAATTVDELCALAGVTKGAFFHHFKSKDELALGAVQHFSDMAEGLFAHAPYRDAADPLDRLLGYVDFRSQILVGQLAEYTCLLGTLAQETYDSHPRIREAVERELAVHIDGLLPDIRAAKNLYAPDAEWTAESLGYYIQSVLQGAFVFAKATQGPDVARESLAHLRNYLTLLFPRTRTSIRTRTRKEKP